MSQLGQNLEDIMLSEINQTQKTNIACLPLQEVPRMVKFIRRTVEECLLGAGGGGNGELASDGYRVSV